MKSNHISKAAARRLTLHAQLLRPGPKLLTGLDGVEEVFDQLGYVQIDTISVIQRAHHHTLWTRLPDYSPDALHQLQTVERKVYEHWGHALSLLPMKDYRFSLPRIARFRDPENRWLKTKRKLCGHLEKPVLERIRAEGPLAAKDFNHERMKGVWNAKPSTGALEILFFGGELMITERRGMERVYDLTERVLPDWVNTKRPSEEELGQHLINRAVRAHGLVTERDIRDHIDTADNGVISATLTKMLEEGEVVPVTIEGLDKQQYHTTPDALNHAARLRATKPAVHLLTPFDNSIILRERLLRLFEFDYSLECYSPAAKRKYGYFVLPILYGEKIVGRLDPKTDRQAGVLLIRKLWLEDNSLDPDAFLPALADKLNRLARFVGADRVKIEKCAPAKYRAPLQKLLKR